MNHLPITISFGFLTMKFSLYVESSSCSKLSRFSFSICLGIFRFEVELIVFQSESSSLSNFLFLYVIFGLWSLLKLPSLERQLLRLTLSFRLVCSTNAALFPELEKRSHSVDWSPRRNSLSSFISNISNSWDDIII